MYLTQLIGIEPMTTISHTQAYTWVYNYSPLMLIELIKPSLSCDTDELTTAN